MSAAGRRCGLFDFPAESRHAQRHQRTDDIEDTVRHVDERRDAQHRGLRHAARVPRHEHRTDRRRILDRAAQQTGFQPPFGIEFPEQTARKDDRDILVGGAEVEEDFENGIVRIKADKLVGTNIFLDTASVGATINIMIAATKAEGVTTIENAAKEPHIVDTANFLNMIGCNVKGAGTDVIRITGTPDLHGAEYMIIPDQIEAGTYMIAAAIAGGKVKVDNIIPKHMDSLSAKLKEMGCQIEEGDDYIEVTSSGNLVATNVKTNVYPGFPTDLQPQMAAVLCKAKGTSTLVETVWENRFQYVEQLKKFGCNMEINADGRIATIDGVDTLKGADVLATDLRAGAAMVIAGLAAEGETRIGNIRFIDRGYEQIEYKLRALGADIERVVD